MASTSPNSLVEITLRRKRELYKSKSALPWAFANMILAVSLYFDMNSGLLDSYFQFPYHIIWYLELFLAVVFTLNTLVNLFTYVKPSIINTPVELSQLQRRLLGVAEGEKGFQTTPPNAAKTLSRISSSPALSTSFLSSTPVDFTKENWAPSPVHSSPGSSPNLSTSSSSWCYQPNTSYGNMQYSHSQENYNTSMVQPIFSRSFSNQALRMRNPPFRSSVSSGTYIKDEADLAKYLKKYEEKEQLMQSIGSESPSGIGASFWSLGHSLLDYSPLLRKYTYQLASRSPQSTTSRPDDDPDSPAHHTAEEVWGKVGVSPDVLFHWTENLRKWLTQTILNRLVKEIDSINETLRCLGSPDLQIGEVSLTTLRQVSLTKSQFIPNLHALLPYLECTPNQEYLVQRAQQLSNGGCMSEFTWNGGGKFKDKPWGDHLPTDTAIVMHLFCTYLDSRLPPHPNYPDGRTFTSQCFRKTPDKPALMKDTLCIYQTKINPPHFKLILGEEVWDLPKGRNNMFHTILLFLHHIKVKENGMLGRVNLGLSGINVLWILEE